MKKIVLSIISLVILLGLISCSEGGSSSGIGSSSSKAYKYGDKDARYGEAAFK